MDTLYIRKNNSPACHGDFVGTYDVNNGYSHTVYGQMTPKMFFLQILIDGFDKLHKSTTYEDISDFIVWLKTKEIEKFSIKFHNHTYISLPVSVIIEILQIKNSSKPLHIGELEFDFESINYVEHSF
jgi:hypothetical protein